MSLLFAYGINRFSHDVARMINSVDPDQEQWEEFDLGLSYLPRSVCTKT